MADSNAAKDSYVLGRSYLAASRLNLQYYLWKDALSFSLHPSIPKPTSGQRVADVATGTAIWLLDLAPTLPADVQYDGLDVDLSQAPVKDWLPRNIHLREWDIYSEVPPDLVGQFDVVHVRLLMVVIRDNDASPVAKNLEKLLKPGGYLQWDELNTEFMYFIPGDHDGGNAASAHERSSGASGSNTVHPAAMTLESVPSSGPGSAFKEARDLMAVQGQYGWVYRLPETLTEAGLLDAVVHTYHDRLALARANSDMMLFVLEEFGVMQTRLKRPDIGEKVQELVRQMEVEVQRGTALSAGYRVCVARKKIT